MMLTAEVGHLERHKRAVSPDDPRFEELARAVRVATDGLAGFARQEESWALRAAKGGASGIATIERTKAPVTLAQLLNDWRSVERELERAEPGSAESKRLIAEFEAARDRYMAAFQERSARE